MGTRLDLVVSDIDPEQGRLCAAEIRSEVRRLEKKLSRFDEASHLSEINRRAGAGPVTIDEKMAHILTLCRGYSDATRGAFDITLPGLGTLWKTRGEADPASRPTSAEIAQALEATGMEKLEIDSDGPSVRFLHPDLTLDLGGFGKVYGLERIRDLLADDLVLIVEEHGRGISRSDTEGMSALGILGMKARANILGGTIVVESREAGGTRLTARLPWPTMEPPWFIRS